MCINSLIPILRATSCRAMPGVLDGHSDLVRGVLVRRGLCHWHPRTCGGGETRGWGTAQSSRTWCGCQLTIQDYVHAHGLRHSVGNFHVMSIEYAGCYDSFLYDLQSTYHSCLVPLPSPSSLPSSPPSSLFSDQFRSAPPPPLPLSPACHPPQPAAAHQQPRQEEQRQRQRQQQQQQVGETTWWTGRGWSAACLPACLPRLLAAGMRALMILAVRCAWSWLKG